MPNVIAYSLITYPSGLQIELRQLEGEAELIEISRRQLEPAEMIALGLIDPPPGE